MADTHTAKLPPTSPIAANRSAVLNSSLRLKVWLRIDDCTDEINQPISLTFIENETVDDLKSKLFDKLNPTRWSSMNDNASVAIGFYGTRNEGEIQNQLTEGVRDKSATHQLLSTSPIRTLLGRNKQFLQQPTPSPANVASKNSIHRRCYSVTDSPPRSASNSPNLINAPKTPLTRYGSASPYSNLHTISQVNQEFSPLPLVSAIPLSAGNILMPGSLKKSKPLPAQQVIDSSTGQKIVFEPDELIINIYNDFFGHMGSQKASDALLVFCNESIRSLPPLLDTLNVTNYIPTNEEIAQQLLETQQISEDVDEFTLSAQLPPELGLNVDCDTGALLEPSASQEDQAEIEREFKLITNEEQLRKISESLQDAKNNADSPKQAILLLPKDYKGDVDFNQSSSRPSSVPSSPGHFKNTKGAETQQESEVTLNAPQYIPLDETEVGMLPPMLESERKKLLDSPPNSPLLSNPISNLPRISTSSSVHRNQLPRASTGTTRDKVFPKINVLIVEDNVINQAILGSFLRKHKISYKVAKNGREAVDKWKEGGIDLIFMDLQLPVLSGMDAAKQIRDLEKKRVPSSTPGENKNTDKTGTKAPVIIVAFTASKSETDKREALISGCNDYLTKPVNLHWLSKKINEWGCMQALIDFDGWREGQSRMTESVIKKGSISKVTDTISTSKRRNRSSSNASQSNKTDNGSRSGNRSRRPTITDKAASSMSLSSASKDVKSDDKL